MAKAPGKSDEGIRSKLKSFFGVGAKSGPDQLGQVKQQHIEFVFSDDVIKDIGPESPLGNRIKHIKDRCDTVLHKKLEDNAVQVLWDSVKDLLSTKVQREDRKIVFKFLCYLIKGQYDHLKMLRLHFFQVIKEHNVFEDLPERLDLFRVLSCDGKDLLHIEEQTGPFLLQWMRDVMSSTKTADFLEVLVNVIKFNATYIDEEIIDGFVLNTCVICTKTGVEGHIELCLKVLDTVICYSYLPQRSLPHFIMCMCQIVNVEKFCQQTWKLVKKLLGTHLGHNAIFTMCCILQDKNNITESGEKLLRGGVFFIGMALWGSQKVTSLKHPPSAVIPAFQQALEQSGSGMVAYEIALTLQRLVNKCGKELQSVAWDTILDIIDALFKHLEEHPQSSAMLISNVHDLLTSLETLIEQGNYNGSRDRIFRIIETCAQKRPSFLNMVCVFKETSILMLVSHEADKIEADKENMIPLLNHLLDKYFIDEVRTKIKLKVLDIVSYMISSNRVLHEDELLENVLLPHLHNIDCDSDTEVRVRATQLLVDLALHCQSPYCVDVLGLLKKMISWPFVVRGSSGPSSPTPGSAVSPDKHKRRLSGKDLDDLQTAVRGIIMVFKSKLYEPHGSYSLRTFELLTYYLTEDYHPKHFRPKGGEFRRAILECFLSLRADGLYRLGIVDAKKPLSFSPYAICMYRDENVEPQNSINGTSSPEATSPCQSPQPAPHTSTIIPYADVFHCVTLCLGQEMDWLVLKSVLQRLPSVLQNKTLILAANREDLDTFCTRLIAMVSERNLGLPEKLLNAPPRFTKSDFHEFIFPVLTSLVSHQSCLDKFRQRELATCLEFGLVSKCARICIRALTICAIENQAVMILKLPAVLLKLSQISATTPMAIPLMEFLSSLIHLPQLYSNFVEDQYMSIFAIALPYTNPFKYSHYTVSLAYHVISMWFLKCRLSFRKGFVGFIVKGLRANVLRQFEETATQRVRMNQDSADRNRTQSLNEEAMRSSPNPEVQLQQKTTAENGKGNRMAAKVAAKQNNILHDETMSTFHRELTETCIDMMARYTFSTFSSLPKRSPVTDFLLNDGQQQHWLLGNKVITITTSGGAKVSKSGLCEKCLSIARTASFKMEEENAPTTGRRRHKSAAVRTVSESVNVKRRSHDDMLLSRQKMFDDLGVCANKSDSSLPRIPSEGLDSSEDLRHTGKGVKGSRALESRSDKMKAMDNVLMALKAQPSDTSIFSPHICNCWCTHWAEVHIRRPTGNTAWMMRIQNDQDMNEYFPDYSLADISNLFMGGKDRKEEEEEDKDKVERDYFGNKIDSSSLGENEYENLLEQHFHGSSDAFMRAMLSTSPANGHTVAEDAVHVFTNTNTQNTDNKLKEDFPITNDFDEINYIRKTASSPDLNPLLQQKLSKDAPTPSELQMALVQKQSTVQLSSNNTSLSEESLKIAVKVEKEVSGGSLSNLQNSGLDERRPRGNTIPSTSDEHPAIKDIERPTSLESLQSLESRNQPKLQGLSGAAKMGGGGLKELVQGGLNPSFVFLQLYHSHFYGKAEDRPILLPNSQDAVCRSLKLLDLIYPYETHKLGVVYVGPGQAEDQTAILSNQYGSARYITFLKGLGHLLKLTDCNPENVYLGGLNHHGNDGDFAYAWHDEFLQVIFHVATLMPNKDKDPNCNGKKLHIGNDYVTIVYNDSVKEYKLGTIKGQFNFVNIIIEPLDHNTNAVIVLCTPDVEELLGHTETKIISDANLALLVRQMAVHADLASTILQKQRSNPKDLYASNWLERLRQIKRVRSKVLQESPSSSAQGHAAGQQDNSPTAEDFTDYI